MDHPLQLSRPIKQVYPGRRGGDAYKANVPFLAASRLSNHRFRNVSPTITVRDRVQKKGTWIVPFATLVYRNCYNVMLETFLIPLEVSRRKCTYKYVLKKFTNLTIKKYAYITLSLW